MQSLPRGMQMPRDWPDPRFPEEPDSPVTVALLALYIVASFLGMIVSLVGLLRWAIS